MSYACSSIPGMSEVDASQLFSQSESLSDMLTIPTLPLYLPHHWEIAKEQDEVEETACESILPRKSTESVRISQDTHVVFEDRASASNSSKNNLSSPESQQLVVSPASRKRKQDSSIDPPLALHSQALHVSSPAHSVLSSAATKNTRVESRKLQFGDVLQRVPPRKWIQTNVWCQAHCSDQAQICSRPLADQKAPVSVYVFP